MSGPWPGLAVPIQATPPGVGPDDVADYWPVVVRVAWFLAAFAAVYAVGWYVVEPALARLVGRRNRNNPTIQDAVSRYFRLVLAVVAFFAGTAVAGYTGPLTTSALVVAAGTLVLGVAGQSVIGSLVSGLVLVLDPEFNIGDYIEWDDGEGTIRSITFRVTRVRTPDGKLVTIPNTVLTSQSITRPYGRSRYRVVDHVGLAYEDDVGEALRHLEAAARELDDVLGDPEPTAYVDDFGSDAVVVRVHYWVDNPTQRLVFDVRSRYAKRVKARLDGAGITISPPSKRDLRGRVEVADG